jgi:hypothetical protein
MSARRRLPDRRGSTRFSFTHDNKLYSATVSTFADGQLGEIFIDADKPDSALAVHANDAAVLASLLLQHGVAAAAIRHSIAGPLATALAQVEEGELVDPRLAFLARASARWLLVEAGEMDLGIAFAELVPVFREITAPCTCDSEMLSRWQQLDRGRSVRRRQTIIESTQAA